MADSHLNEDSSQVSSRNPSPEPQEAAHEYLVNGVAGSDDENVVENHVDDHFGLLLGFCDEMRTGRQTTRSHELSDRWYEVHAEGPTHQPELCLDILREALRALEDTFAPIHLGDLLTHLPQEWVREPSPEPVLKINVERGQIVGLRAKYCKLGNDLLFTRWCKEVGQMLSTQLLTVCALLSALLEFSSHSELISIWHVGHLQQTVCSLVLQVAAVVPRTFDNFELHIEGCEAELQLGLNS